MNGDGYALFLLRNAGESKVAFDEPGVISPDYITERSITEVICKAASIVIARRGQGSSAHKRFALQHA
jgi:hypothetical protein